MESLYLLIPLSIVLVFVIALAFFVTPAMLGGTVLGYATDRDGNARAKAASVSPVFG